MQAADLHNHKINSIYSVKHVTDTPRPDQCTIPFHNLLHSHTAGHACSLGDGEESWTGYAFVNNYWLVAPVSLIDDDEGVCVCLEWVVIHRQLVGKHLSTVLQVI
jgi:hypothetical protein